MLDYLDKLRAKPVHVRKRIALFTTGALSLIIASVAWSTWNTEPDAAEAIAETTRSPWGVVSGMWSEGREAMTAAVVSAKVQLERAAEGSVASYDQSTAGAASTINVSSGEQSTEETIPDDMVATPVLQSDISSAAIRTRPGLWQGGATGTVSSDNMVQ